MPPRRKSKNWRSRPMTKAQQRQLQRYDLPFRNDMLQGEASDLIGTKRLPSHDELQILRFFKIQGLETYTQTVARRGIEQLLSNPGNVKKWESRPAEKEQKEIYSFLKVPIPCGLNWIQANTTIDELFSDEKNEEAWIAHQEHLDEIQDAADERKEWFKETREDLNEWGVSWDNEKISKKLFAKVVETLETKGMTLEEISDKDEIVFKTAYELEPTRSKPYEFTKSSARIVTTRQNSRNPANRQTTPLFGTPQQVTEGRNVTGWVISIIVIVGLFIFVALDK